MRAASYHNLGAALQSDGRLGEAATAYERALQIDPDYAPSHDGLGSVLRQRGQLDEAIRELQEALRLSPHTAYYTDHALRDTVENSITNCLKFERSYRHG